jgi:cytochrome c-type biogenesis protein CcmH/NrfG
MSILYSFIFLLLATGILFIAVPFIKNKMFFSKSFFVIASFVVIFSLSLYFTLCSPQDLRTWLTQGRNHYELLVQMDQLGGIDGMIDRIKLKLVENPEDAEGWFILGRLYLAKNDKENAEKAFQRVNVMPE